MIQTDITLHFNNGYIKFFGTYYPCAPDAPNDRFEIHDLKFVADQGLTYLAGIECSARLLAEVLCEYSMSEYGQKRLDNKLLESAREQYNDFNRWSAEKDIEQWTLEETQVIKADSLGKGFCGTSFDVMEDGVLIAEVVAKINTEKYANLICAAPEMLGMLKDCRTQFLHYAHIHRSKKTEDGNLKADANESYAKEILAVINKAGGKES